MGVGARAAACVDRCMSADFEDQAPAAELDHLHRPVRSGRFARGARAELRCFLRVFFDRHQDFELKKNSEIEPKVQRSPRAAAAAAAPRPSGALAPASPRARPIAMAESAQISQGGPSSSCMIHARAATMAAASAWLFVALSAPIHCSDCLSSSSLPEKLPMK